MSKRVRRRRGTQAQHDEFTGADGEITVNTTDYRLHAHDGVTGGGVATAREDEVLHQDQNLSDVNSAATSRSNLGLGSAATESDTKYVFRANNLSDLGSAATARTNLGLGTSDAVNFASVSDSGNRVYSASNAPASTALSDHESAVVTLGGDFDAGQDVRCERIGNRVTITGTSVLSHTAGTDASAATAIPSQFRPTNEIQNTYTTSGILGAIRVTTAGIISTVYSDGSFGNITRSDSQFPPSITYLIT